MPTLWQMAEQYMLTIIILRSNNNEFGRFVSDPLEVVSTVATDEICPRFSWCDVAVFKLFSHFYMHVELFNHRSDSGCRAVCSKLCTRPSEYSAFHLLQVYY